MQLRGKLVDRSCVPLLSWRRDALAEAASGLFPAMHVEFDFGPAVLGTKNDTPRAALTALIDTGAERSCVPGYLVHQLPNLVQARTIPLTGIGGTVYAVALPAWVHLDGRELPRLIPVAILPGRDRCHATIGWDILREFVSTFRPCSAKVKLSWNIFHSLWCKWRCRNPRHTRVKS